MVTHWTQRRFEDGSIRTACGLTAFRAKGCAVEFDTVNGGRIASTDIRKQATCLRCTR